MLVIVQKGKIMGQQYDQIKKDITGRGVEWGSL